MTVIETYKHKYPVYCVKETNTEYESYICRNEADGGLCSVLAVKNKTLFAGIIDDLTSIPDSAFTDFRENFISGGKLCVVMSFCQGITLKTKLNTEAMPLAERLEIGRRILERIVLRRIPDYFIAKGCSTKNIIVDRDLTLHFNYSIEDIDKLAEYTHSAALTCVESVLRELFSRELERMIPSELADFFADFDEEIKGGKDDDMIGVYGSYCRMMSAVSEDGSSEEPKTFWFTAWEKIKKAAARLKKILLVLVLLAVLGYLIYTILSIGKNEEKTVNFEKIGTVEIQNR